MKSHEAIARIRAREGEIRALGADGVFLYGSVANDSAGADSDVDIFIDRDPARKFGFIELTELEFLLQDILGVEVDVSTRTGLHPALTEAIEKSAVRVL